MSKLKGAFYFYWLIFQIFLLKYPLFSQATVIGTDCIDGIYATFDLTDQGIFRQAQFQATVNAGAGIRKWEFCQGTSGVPDYSTNWRPYSGPPLTLVGYNQTIDNVPGTACALANTGFFGTGGFLPSITSGRYYTYNITEYSTPGTPLDEFMSVLETDFAPCDITTVTQSPVAGSVMADNSVLVTAQFATIPSVGENIYLRWSTTINFVTSTLVQMNVTGFSGDAIIPCQSFGTTIYYYVYSSNRSSSAILSDVGLYGQVAHDMSTLVLNNNGGPNYQYTVGATTSACGTYYVPSACFPTIASFVTFLNANTITCPVTCYVEAGHTETAPSGGIHLTQTGTSSNPITIQKYGIGANPVINAQVGTITLISGILPSVDNIFTLNGSDYITIDGIDLYDNNTTIPETMECGYGLYKMTGNDGCQFNQIINCNITLTASNSAAGPGEFKDGSRGIFAGNSIRSAISSALTVTSIDGTNSYNIFYGNSIKNVFSGIILRGWFDAAPYSFYDQGNEIGFGIGNIIENYGGSGTNTAYGIYTIYQNQIVCGYNSINNTASGGTAHTSTLYGIFMSSVLATGSTLTAGAKYNNIALTQGATSNQMTGIRVGNPGNFAGNVDISNNTIQNCTFNIGASGAFFAIDQEFNCSGYVNINYNQILNNTISSTSNLPSYLIYNNNSSQDVSVTFNTCTNNYKTGIGTGTVNGYFNQTGILVGSTEIVSDNTFDGLGVLATSISSACGIRLITSTNQTKIITNNNISNITGGTGTTSFWTAGIIADGMSSSCEVSNNIVSSISSAANAIGINCAAQASITTSANETFSIYNNTISDISSTGVSSTVAGIAAYSVTSGGGSIDITNNSISQISSSGTTSPPVRGISLGGGTSGATYDIRYNEISNIEHTAVSGTNIISGIYLFPGAVTVNIYGTSIHDVYTNSTSNAAAAAGIYIPSGTTTFNFYNNFIQRIYAPSCTNSVSVSGMYLASTLCTYNLYYNTIALGENTILSGGTNFGCAGIYYPTSTTFNIKNNIIYVKANVTGTGVASCIRRSSGTANTVASNFSSASNNNFYWINTASRNYIYVEGANTSTIVNGYAWSSATTSVASNLNNDACFNVEGTDNTSYKFFMSPGAVTRELGSYYDVPPFAGGVSLPNNLKLTVSSTNYSESKAVDAGSVGTDWEGDVRQGYLGYAGLGTAPDVGADEGEFITLAPSCDLLPIELTKFIGWHNSDLYLNELLWTTFSELNSKKFEIEKSITGSEFYLIGSVDAAVNSSALLHYQFNDDDPFDGINYYRLKLIDQDNSVSYSQIIAITITSSAENSVFIYPNPSSEILNLVCNTGEYSNITFQIFDVFGRSIQNQISSSMKQNNYIEIDVSKLDPSIYFMNILQGSDRVGIYKIVIQ